MTADSDSEWMQRAFALAWRGLFTCDPNPRVGCVLVRDGAAIGEGWHIRAGEGHAEVNAIANAGGPAHTRGATAYVSLEPCCHQGRTGPCTSALIEAGVTTVVTGMRDPNPKVAGKGLAILREAGLSVRELDFSAQSEALNPGFIARMQRRRPFVRLKLAASVDGRTAMASGESQWITGPAAREDVQRLRARASAVLTGSGTVLQDDPTLNVRLPEARWHQPLRVVLDSRQRVPPGAKLFSAPSPVLLVNATPASEAYRSALPSNASLVTLPIESRLAHDNDAARIDLPALMHHLAEREVNELHAECGAELAGSLLNAGLVDELVVYMAPVIMGSEARPLFNLPGLSRMADRFPLKLIDINRLGEDWRITLQPLARPESKQRP